MTVCSLSPLLDGTSSMGAPGPSCSSTKSNASACENAGPRRAHSATAKPACRARSRNAISWSRLKSSMSNVRAVEASKNETLGRLISRSIPLLRKPSSSWSHRAQAVEREHAEIEPRPDFRRRLHPQVAIDEAVGIVDRQRRDPEGAFPRQAGKPRTDQDDVARADAPRGGRHAIRDAQVGNDRRHAAAGLDGASFRSGPHLALPGARRCCPLHRFTQSCRFCYLERPMQARNHPGADRTSPSPASRTNEVAVPVFRADQTPPAWCELRSFEIIDLADGASTRLPARAAARAAADDLRHDPARAPGRIGGAEGKPVPRS